MNKIVVIGSSNTDMILKLSRIPKPGETLLGGDFSIAPGGKGANQAVAAARGGGQVTFIAKVGNDIFGQQAIEGFLKDGINVDFINKEQETSSGVALIFVDKDGENSIGVASGANAHLLPSDLDKSIGCFKGADIVLMQLETPVETIVHAADIAYRKNIPVILNPAPAHELSEKLLKLIYMITPNETEAELLTGIKVNDEKSAEEASQILTKTGVQNVIITLGAKGVYLYSDNLKGMIPGFKVKAVDTTAAGDVFNATLSVGMAQGKSIRESIMYANAAAALSVTKLGAQPSAPSLKKIEEFLKQSHNNE